MLTSLFSLFYVTGEFHRFLHRGRANFLIGSSEIKEGFLKDDCHFLLRFHFHLSLSAMCSSNIVFVSINHNLLL